MGLSESPSPMVRGQTCSPIVDKTWRKRTSWKDARQSFRWAFLNVILAIIMYLEISYSMFVDFFQLKHPLLWYIEFTLLVVFVLNVLFDVFRYVSNYLFSGQVEVTQQQKFLLGVKDSDPGFCVSPVKSTASSDGERSLVFSSSPSSQTAYSPSSSPWSSLGHVTPTNMGSFSGSYSYASPGTSFQSNSTGGGHVSFDRSGSLSQHGNMSASFSQNMSFSPSMAYSPGNSISSLDSSGIRSRLSLSTSFRSPSPSDKMTDLQSLTFYLREQEEKDYRASLSSPDLSFNSPSFWSYGRPSLDYSHVLRKNQYQMASRSPQSYKSRADDADKTGEEVWRPLGVTDDNLFLWIERLRKWVGNTILVKLCREIENINLGLRKIGSEDTEIGEVGVSTLKQLALTKGTYVPTLNVIVPYLDFSANQEYLVKRIKELGSDGCISEYSWSSGGNGGLYGKKWGEHLPTDAGIIMHMFCCYLDARLPPEMKYPDGKTFTCQFFMKTPDKPNLEKDNMLLYQASINPPHFQVVIKNTVYNLPKGRNNLFHAILFFLFHVKTKDKGMLGRVNLGLSGVNLLCVLDD